MTPIFPLMLTGGQLDTLVLQLQQRPYAEVAELMGTISAQVDGHNRALAETQKENDRAV